MPPSASACTSVVRLGPVDSPAARRLRDAILSHLGAAAPTADPAPAAAAATTTTTISVSNRYFRARVRLEDIGAGGSDAEETWKEDGVILVFPNDEAAATGGSPDAPGFPALAAVHAAAEAGGAGELLRLCVGLSAAPLAEDYRATKQYEQQYAQRIHWCLDRGYEYVECDLVDLSKGHEERDKEGFARIVEALQGTVWSSAIMEPKKKMELKQTYDQDKQDLVDDGADQEDRYEPPDPSKLPPVGDVVLASTAEDKEREEKARKEIMGDLKNEDAIAEDPAERQREQADEKLYMAMEHALKQASRIREASRSGTMSDHERRQRAGDAAALLYQLMDQMGFDESDDDEEADESDDENLVEEGRLDTVTSS